jgi:hypothetical protein
MSKPWGCHSQPRKDGYWAKAGTFVNERLEVVQNARWIVDVGSRECQYRKSTPDPRCEGCTCP